jgi:hypothetical protein
MLSRAALTLSLCILVAGFQAPHKRFVIDESMPYVYLAFDHFGKRKPIGRDEDFRGLWLRLVNNCSLPIRTDTFEPETGDPGVGILDDVIVPSNILITSNYQSGDEAQQTPPRGYSRDIVTTTVVAPGSSLLFSVPANHVTEKWYLRVRFQLEPPGRPTGPQPYSFVDFTWTMIPPKERASGRP